jgi:tRNA dimethylallyltransferase
MIETNSNTVIIICGPTAIGKTAFAIELAQFLNTSIISADSRQCYREMNIGVAKPSQQELAAVPHYFINSHSVTDEVNAVTFEQYALNTCDEIFEQHSYAVMVGGTGLYIKAFCEGLDEIPSADPAIRQKIQADFEVYGIGWLQDQVQHLDPAFWHVGEQQNPQRLMRALEVVQSTGKPITTFRKGEKLVRPFNIVKIGLELPRAILNDRINQRVDEMVNNGLVNEVETVLSYRHLNALQTVGYKELFDYFDGVVSLQQAIENIKIHTRQYAKRQMTWFKKDLSVQWFNPQNSSIQSLQHLWMKNIV